MERLKDSFRIQTRNVVNWRESRWSGVREELVHIVSLETMLHRRRRVRKVARRHNADQ